MNRVASHEPGAIEDLYDRFSSLVFRMTLQALPSRTDAEDATQEVFTRLWKTADRYNCERAALVTWVMLITRRHIVDRLRRSRARISAVSAGESGIPASVSEPTLSMLEGSETFSDVIRRIEGLPELQRVVVTRSYLSGQTLRQIADELDIPLGTVKSALSRALARLREHVSEDDA
ncbi:MAG: sigma-70 family RNA polymerase sigma factor [Planctomycetota bacterium]